VRVLVTNDDGVHAPGITALAARLWEAGHDVLVAAPVADVSGAGTGTGPQRRGAGEALACRHVMLDGLPHVAAYAIEALPALCVTIACTGAFGPPPELVISGVNRGRNVGRSVLHSGTVGAALTAAQHGICGIALSAQATREPVHFDTAAALGVALAEQVAAMRPPLVLNCNTPNRPLGELAGVRLASIEPSEIVASSAIVDGTVQLRFANDGALADPLSDEALTRAGYATVTPLRTGAADLCPRQHDELARLLEAIGQAAARAGRAVPARLHLS
jgi:5'-nucleotidase